MEKVDKSNFILHIASVEASEPESHEIKVNDASCTLKVQYGAFSDALQKVLDALNEVKQLHKLSR